MDESIAQPSGIKMWLPRVGLLLAGAGVLYLLLGSVITFYPGAQCSWYLTAAALLLGGLLVPKTWLRVLAVVLLLLSVNAAVDGYRDGQRHQQRMQAHVFSNGGSPR